MAGAVISPALICLYQTSAEVLWFKWLSIHQNKCTDMFNLSFIISCSEAMQKMLFCLDSVLQEVSSYVKACVYSLFLCEQMLQPLQTESKLHLLINVMGLAAQIATPQANVNLRQTSCSD